MLRKSSVKHQQLAIISVGVYIVCVTLVFFLFFFTSPSQAEQCEVKLNRVSSLWGGERSHL